MVLTAAARHVLSVDPGEVHFAVCVGHVVSRGDNITFDVTFVRCADVRETEKAPPPSPPRAEKKKRPKKKKTARVKWDGAAIEALLKGALAAGGVGAEDYASTVCLIENQHMNNDRGKEVAGAVQAFAQMNGLLGVTKVHARDRGAFFRFAPYAEVHGGPATANREYRHRKKEAHRCLLEEIAAYKARFSQQALDTIGKARERSGKFDIADAVTLAIAHVERRRRRSPPSPNQGPPPPPPPPPAAAAAAKRKKTRPRPDDVITIDDDDDDDDDVVFVKERKHGDD